MDNTTTQATWGDGLKLEDTNMANVGTEADRAQRKANAQAEPEWRLAGPPLTPGVVIWRVENENGRFGVKAWPREQYGQLFMGDSFIILQTTDGETIEPNERHAETFHWKNASFKSGEHKLDVFYWLGPDSTIDEKGTAAIKTIELDSYLDGKCTHHREVGGNETSEFFEMMKAVAPNGLTYLEGGHEGGFKKSSVQTYDKEGRPLGFKEIDDNVALAGQTATLIRTKATGVAAKGKEYVEITHGKIDPSLLLSDCVYLIDAGSHVFVWIGKDASDDEQDSALIYAERYLAARPGGESIPSVTIRQGNETEAFTSLFGSYKDYEEGTDSTVEFIVKEDFDKHPVGPLRESLESKFIEACKAACARGSVGGDQTFSLRGLCGPFQQDPMVQAPKQGTVRCLMDCSTPAAEAIQKHITHNTIRYRGVQVVGVPTLIELEEEAAAMQSNIEMVHAAPPPGMRLPPKMENDLARVERNLQG